MELSPAGFDGMFADLAMMDRKTGRAYLQLLGYLRRFGSVPSGERALASVLGVTVGFLREVAWPLLEDRLELSADGRRYSDPDVTASRPRRPVREPTDDRIKNQQQQDAAKARWAKQRAAGEPLQTDAQAHPETHAERMRSDAETHVISMRGASEMHAETHSTDAPSASSSASGAYALAHARALSPSDTSLAESPDNWRDSLGEREDALMRSDASAHAERMRSDASAHASSDAPAPEAHRASGRKQQPPSRPSIPIPPDWRPTPEDALAARGRGYDPDELAQGFLDWYLGRDEVSPDWNAKFRTWMRREKSPPNSNLQQGTIKLPIEGGVSDEADDPAAAVGDGVEAQWVRASRQLKAEIGPVPYRTWMSKAAIVGIEDGEATISLPSTFLRDYVRTNFLDRLTAFWRADNPTVLRVQAVVASVERRTAGG
jgi:hypothetical protein